jgi:hypothetical protein
MAATADVGNDAALDLGAEAKILYRNHTYFGTIDVGTLRTHHTKAGA